jgi:metallo-beta-lactamase class B
MTSMTLRRMHDSRSGAAYLPSAILLLALLLGAVLPARHARAADPADWTIPIAPFRIADDLYYVGSRDLASYLIHTTQGEILINSSLESSVPLIRASVEALGFHFKDIKILLISHAHFDHDAGSAGILKETGAKYMVMDADVPVVESGGATDFFYKDPVKHYPAAKVSRVLHDGDEVRLGNAVLVAHKTPGHTQGCTTWSLKVRDAGHVYDAVIVGSWNVNAGFRLVDKPGEPASYPGIAQDFKHTFATLETLPIDVFLGAHGSYFDMLGKLDRQKSDAQNVWIDPAGYRAKVAERKGAFEAELARQLSDNSAEKSPNNSK